MSASAATSHRRALRVSVGCLPAALNNFTQFVLVKRRFLNLRNLMLLHPADNHSTAFGCQKWRRFLGTFQLNIFNPNDVCHVANALDCVTSLFGPPLASQQLELAIVRFEAQIAYSNRSGAFNIRTVTHSFSRNLWWMDPCNVRPLL